MRGRPKLTDSRDNQYRVRLNDEENQMLDYVSKKIDKPKAEIFRVALSEYYNNVRLNEFNLSANEEEAAWYLGTISLKRVVKCPYCNTQNRIDLEDESTVSTDERQMGPENLFEFDYEEDCTYCDKRFRVLGYISEYPAGALNHEEIKVLPIDE